MVATEDFYGQVGLALSAWKSTNFQLAYSSYGAALPLASTTEQRSHILAAMATIAYKFQVTLTGQVFLKRDKKESSSPHKQKLKN